MKRKIDPGYSAREGMYGNSIDGFTPSKHLVTDLRPIYDQKTKHFE
jgi:hypothetical protein